MNYCANCGAQLEQNSKFCTSCGTKIENVNTPAQQEIASHVEVNQKRKSTKFIEWKKSVAIIAIPLLIVLGAVAGVLLHKSPKELYLLAEVKSYTQKMEEVNRKYGDSLDFQELALEKPSNSEVTLSGDFMIDSLESEEDVQMVRDIISNSSLTMKSDVNPLSNEGYYSLGLNVADEKAVDIEFYQSQDQFGLKVPLLYEKFIYLNYDQFGEFMSMIDPGYEGPETLELSKLELADLQLTDKEKEYLQKRYSEFILSHLKDENFSLEKGIDYEFEGTKMKLKKVTFKLSPSETKQLMNDFLDQLIADSTLQDMIVNRAKKVAETAAMFEGSNSSEYSKADMKKELLQGLKDTKDELKDSQFTSGLTSELLIDNKERIIDRKVSVVIDEGSTPVELSILGKNIPVENNKRIEEMKLIIEEQEEDYKVAFEVRNEIEEKKSKQTVENLDMSFYSESYGEIDGKLALVVTSNFDGKAGSKQTINRDFEFIAFGNEFYDIPGGLSGTLTETKDVNVKKEYANNKYDLQLEIEDEYGSGTIMLTVDAKTKLQNKVDMPKLNSNSSEGINVAKITEDQIYDIQEEVGTNIMVLAEKIGLDYEDMWGSSNEYSEDYGYEEEYYDEEYYDEEYLESY